MAEDKKVRALFIFEIIGRPPEHIKSSLEELVSKLGEQKGIKIVNKDVYEPKPLEKGDVKDLFTTFAEVELETDNINLIFDIVLNMLPAHVEILEPEELRLKNFDLSSVLSNLAVKLHRYDEIAKALTMERKNLVNQLNEMQGKINESCGSEKKD